MRSMVLAATLVAFGSVSVAKTGSAEEVFIPPIVEATITGVTSEALGDGRWLVTIAADVVNTSAAPLEGVELMVTDARDLPAAPPLTPVTVGAMAVLEPVAVAWELEAPGAHDPAEGLHPIIAGSAVDIFGEPIAVWVEIREEAQQ